MTLFKEDKKEMPDEDQNHAETSKPTEEPTAELSQADKLKLEVEDWKDKYVRLFAEFDNMRKRNERDRMELIKYAHEEVIVEMLNFLEDFERSLAAAKASPGEVSTIIKGLEMVLAKMQQLLKKYDVREIEALGKKFDHNCHEALMVEESPDREDDTVSEVFQKGYTLGGRVVRTAKVKVSKKPA
ncbi:MAG: nucleotide exchange factor GrpE [Candidatus Omnitrophica bacterium]|nr:nucleotide exchange factor GrpE [Candidatus Omnitrophota bacterium]